jgi:predicted SAM-dependent methyltransferase
VTARGIAKRAVRIFNSSQKWVEIRRKGALLPLGDIRALAAQLYLSGEGLEIGALNDPLPLPKDAHARYVDRLGMDELRRHYPGLDLVGVDVIDDGERLASIRESSQDFIIANHFLEHCQDPILTLQTLTSRLKPGGRLFMAVPDADHTFDRERPSTTFEHLQQDHTQGPERSRLQHYGEWVNLVEGHSGAIVDARVAELADMEYSVHYHVWRMHDLLGFLTRCIDEAGVDLTLELAMRNGPEVVCVLRRVETAPRRSAGSPPRGRGQA